MPNYTEIESLDMLIKAVETYQNDLATNYKVLVNASEVCDAAMGSDDVAKKHIARLNEALEELKKTASLAQNVKEALEEDRKNALNVLED